MIDHASIAVSDLERSRAFYSRVLAPLGMSLLVERETQAGFGKRYPELWLNWRPDLQPSPEDVGAHLCLRASSVEAVRVFHAEALAAGGRDDGAPGERQASMTAYYAAFIRDPDGNRIEAATFPKSE